MRKFLALLLILVSFNLSAQGIRTWRCNELIVTYYENNTMQVSELIYDVMFVQDYMILKMNGKVMLLVNKGSYGSITITNVDNRKDKKHFVKYN